MVAAVVAASAGGRRRAAEAAQRQPRGVCLRALALLVACRPAVGISVAREPKASQEPLRVDPDAVLAEALHGLAEQLPAISLPELPPPLALSQFRASSWFEPDGNSTRGVQPFMSLDVHRIAWNEATRLNQRSPPEVSLNVDREASEFEFVDDEEGPDGKGKIPKRRIYLTTKEEAQETSRRRPPHPQVTLFKVIFGCGFIVCLATTCIARQLEAVPEQEQFERAPEQEPATKAVESKPAQASADQDPGSSSSALLRPPPSNWPFIKAGTTVLLWMMFSVFFIIFNKYLFSRGGFPYPVTLTAMHMGSCYGVFGLVRFLPKQWRYTLMPDADKHIPLPLYVKGLVPAALLMAICLGIGNLGFLYATVAFIQMVKPVNIVVTSLAGFAWGLELATPTHLFIAVLVSGGVAIAAAGEVQFSLVGLICQLAASTGEGLRLIILQGIMQGSLKLDPLSTLYRFTPVAGLALCVLSCLIEGPVNWSGLKMPGILVLNCLMAVCLNVLIAATVQQTSAVVFVLAGVTKDIATIAISAVLYSSPITVQEVGGYAISMIGIGLYKVYKDNLQTFKDVGMIKGFQHVVMPTKKAQ